MFNKIILVMMFSAIAGVLRVDYVAIDDFQNKLNAQYKQDNIMMEQFMNKYNVDVPKEANVANELKRYAILMGTLIPKMREVQSRDLLKEFSEVVKNRKMVIDIERGKVFLKTNTMFLIHYLLMDEKEKLNHRLMMWEME